MQKELIPYFIVITSSLAKKNQVKIGNVIIGISDIDGLSEQLSSKLSVNSDLKSNIASFTESTIREGISSGETLSFFPQDSTLNYI